MLRMLQVPELKRAMGFDDEFALDHGTRRDRIRLPRNGVCPPVMEAIIRSLTKQVTKPIQTTSRVFISGDVSPERLHWQAGATNEPSLPRGSFAPPEWRSLALTPQLRKPIHAIPARLRPPMYSWPLLGQRRAADIAADGPGSRGPDLCPERKRRLDAHRSPVCAFRCGGQAPASMPQQIPPPLARVHLAMDGEKRELAQQASPAPRQTPHQAHRYPRLRLEKSARGCLFQCKVAEWAARSPRCLAAVNRSNVRPGRT